MIPKYLWTIALVACRMVAITVHAAPLKAAQRLGVRSMAPRGTSERQEMDGVSNATSNANITNTQDINGMPNNATDNTNTNDDDDSPYTMAYYPDWVDLDPADVDFSLFDWIDFAFALPTSSYGLTWDDDSAPSLLKNIVEAAQEAKTKVKLSIGGWSDSQYFSDAVGDTDTRATFVKQIANLYDTMGVDGIDIDWEYPGQEGAAGNKFSKDDTANYLLFLKALRQALPPAAKITAAVTPATWVDESGSPAKDLSAFAQVLDWVLIMNYDVNVPPQQHPGPNAPLSDACGTSQRPQDNAEGGLNAWKAAGFPANQIALGIAAYGYIHKSDATELEMRRELPRQTNTTISSSNTTSFGGNNTTSTNGSGAVTLQADTGGESQIQFKSLLEQGALSSSFEGAGGFTRHWDNCSSTPFLTSDGVLLSYDDPESIKMKGAYAREHGMRGLGMWDIHGDTKDWALTKAARAGLGLSGSNTTNT